MIMQGQRPERPSSLAGELMPDKLWDVVNTCWQQKALRRPDMNAVVNRLLETVIA